MLVDLKFKIANVHQMNNKKQPPVVFYKKAFLKKHYVMNISVEGKFQRVGRDSFLSSGFWFWP